MPTNSEEFWFALRLSTEDAARSLEQFKGALERTGSTIGEVTRNLEAVGTAAERQTSKVGGLVSYLQSHMGTINRMSLVAGGILATTGFAVRGWLRDATEALKVDQQLAASMKLAGEYSETEFEALSKLATQLQRLTGENDETIKTAMSLGYTFGLTTEQIKQVMPLLASMVATGKTDFPSAMQTLGLALQGQTRGLRQFGIRIKAVTGSAEEYEVQIAQVEERMQALARAGKQNTTEYRKLEVELAELERKYAAASDKGAILNEIFANSGRLMGLAEEMAGTYAVKVAALQQSWGDFKEQLGKALIPTIEVWTDRLQRVADALNNMDPSKMQALVDVVLGVGGLAGAVVVLGAVANGIVAITNAINVLVASAGFKALSAIAASVGGWGVVLGVAAGLAGLGVGIKQAIESKGQPVWVQRQAKEVELANKAMGDRWAAMAEAYRIQQQREQEKQVAAPAPSINYNNVNIYNPNPSGVANAVLTALNRAQVGSTATRAVITRANPSGCP